MTIAEFYSVVVEYCLNGNGHGCSDKKCTGVSTENISWLMIRDNSLAG